MTTYFYQCSNKYCNFKYSTSLSGTDKYCPECGALLIRRIIK